MTTERLSALAIMNIHYEKPVDYDAVVWICGLTSIRSINVLLVDWLTKASETYLLAN